MAADHIEVYLEEGQKKTFAGALEWPGWCRSGRDEDSALQALVDYAPRYAKMLGQGSGFKPPADVSTVKIVERLTGDATTDFGAPGKAPSYDMNPVDDSELARLHGILKACWAAFDAAVEKATGIELRKGARGGGRELDKIVRHVLESEGGYLGALGWKLTPSESSAVSDLLIDIRQAALDGLTASAHGEIPERGPRGGQRWTARYFVRREAWHVLDHVWEIEDRVL